MNSFLYYRENPDDVLLSGFFIVYLQMKQLNVK